MAETVERTSHQEPEADEAGGSRRRRWSRRITAAIIVVVLLAGAAAVRRATFSAAARSKVEVAVGSPRLTCAPQPDGTPGTTPGGAGVVWAGMECRLAVRITNHGRTSVDLDDLRLPSVGPGTGAAVIADGLDPDPHPDRAPAGPADGGTAPPDALFALDRTLDPGETARFDVVFHHNASGCSPKGLRLGLAHSPDVVVRSLGLDGVRSARGEPVWFWSASDLDDCSPGG